MRMSNQRNAADNRPIPGGLRPDDREEEGLVAEEIIAATSRPLGLSSETANERLCEIVSHFCHGAHRGIFSGEGLDPGTLGRASLHSLCVLCG